MANQAQHPDRQPDGVGAEYYINEIKPRYLIPMHFWDDYQLLRSFQDRMQGSSTKVIDLTHRGQEIDLVLGLESGDKILFIEKPNGEVMINNASAQAIYKAQQTFAGVAEEIGVSNEDDVQELVNEVRYGKDK